MTTVIQSAIRLGIEPGQIIVLSNNTMIGMSRVGVIYQHKAGRWRELRPVAEHVSHERRATRYAHRRSA